MSFWDIPHTIEIGELWSIEYGIRPPDAFPLDITNAHPLLPGQTYTTSLIPWLPDTGFLFTGLGVAGGFGFTGLSDANPGHPDYIPGSSVINALWLTGGPGIDCDTCGTIGVLRITFHEGKPPKHPVPEPGSLLLLGGSLDSLGIFRRAGARVRRCGDQPEEVVPVAMGRCHAHVDGSISTQGWWRARDGAIGSSVNTGQKAR